MSQEHIISSGALFTTTLLPIQLVHTSRSDTKNSSITLNGINPADDINSSQLKPSQLSWMLGHITIDHNYTHQIKEVRGKTQNPLLQHNHPQQTVRPPIQATDIVTTEQNRLF
jgi:hypothetical protein